MLWDWMEPSLQAALELLKYNCKHHKDFMPSSVILWFQNLAKPLQITPKLSAELNTIVSLVWVS